MRLDATRSTQVLWQDAARWVYQKTRVLGARLGASADKAEADSELLLCYVDMFSLNRVKLAKISRLLDDLDSPTIQVVKNTTKLLDEAIYPPRIGGLRTIEQENKRSEEHFSKLRGTAIADLLNERISNGLPNARKYAFGALTHMGDGRAQAHILNALKDSEPSVRVEAIDCCSYVREDSAVPTLIKLLSDESDDVVWSAAHALGRLRAFDSIPKLLELTRSENHIYRESAVSALGYIKDKSTLPILRDALKDKHRSVRKAAKFALGNYDMERRKDA